MKLKKAAALILAAVLALGTVGCASQNVTTIAHVNDQAIPAGIYLTYMVNAYDEATRMVENGSDKVLKQKVEDVPAADWITLKADEQLQKYATVERQFVEQGLTLAPEVELAIEQEAQYQWQFVGSIYEQNGISYESYKKTITSTYREDALFQAQYGTEGKTPVANDELTTAFTKDYVHVRYITASLLDELGQPLADTKPTLDKLEAVRTAAAGSTLAEAILASEKAQAEENGETFAHTHDDASAHVYYLDKTATAYTPEFITQLDALAEGEAKVLQTDTVAYLIEKLASDPADMEEYRGALMYRLRIDAFNELLAQWNSSAPLVYVQEAKNLYKPAKLDIEFKA